CGPLLLLLTALMPTVKSLVRRWRAETSAEPDIRLDGLVITDLSGGPRREEVGGKGRGLHRLQQAGLPVLPTRVVPVSCFDHHRQRHGLETPLQESWNARLIAEARRLGSRLAVRS